MRIIKNKFIPFGRYKSINLFGIVFTKRDLDDVSVNHEGIHSMQMFEMAAATLLLAGITSLFIKVSFLWILPAICFFYLWYGIEYIIVRFFHKKQHDAYRDVSFEEEAYAHEKDLDYLKHRKLFSWIKYLKIHKNSN